MLGDIVKRTRAHLCIDCGRCTGICPVSRVDRVYSPRRLLLASLARTTESSNEKDPAIGSVWSCLACGLCEETCPSGIEYVDLTKGVRVEAVRIGMPGQCSHGGAFQSMMRMQTAEDLKPNRMEWVKEMGVEYQTEGEVLFFVGCAPFLATFFAETVSDPLAGPRAAMRIFEKLGIKPVLLENERCCGHDLLWSGEKEAFEKLARINVEEIRHSGAKTVLFTCPEGYRTMAKDYPEVVGDLGFHVQHMVEFIATKIDKGELTPELKVEGKSTFQDPCRLGRHMGVINSPREILKRILADEMVEMDHHGRKALCCGVNAWLGCDSRSKQMQIRRLKEACATDAARLITACPKCAIHLNCTMKDEAISDDIQINIEDITALVARSLGIEATAKAEVEHVEAS